MTKQRENGRLERRDPRASISGSMAEMGTVDLVQTLEAGKRTGVLRVVDRGRSAAVWFRQGRIVDAELGRRRAEHAFYGLLRWQEGDFTVDFGPIDRAERIRLGTQALLLEGIRRADDWNHLLARLPPLDEVYRRDDHLLSHRRAGLPDWVRELLRLFDGHRTLGRVLEDAERDELEAAEALIELFAEGVIRPGAAPEGDTPDPERVEWFSAPADPRAEPIRAAVAAPAPRVVQFPARDKKSSRAPAQPPVAQPAAPQPAPPPAAGAIAARLAPLVHVEEEAAAVSAASAAVLEEHAAAGAENRGVLVAGLLALAALAGAALGAWKVLAERSAAPAAISVEAPAAAPAPAAPRPPAPERPRRSRDRAQVNKP